MFLTLNELSINRLNLHDSSEASDIITKFVLFVKSLSEQDIIDELIFPDDLFSIHLVDGYGLTEWLTDKSVEFKIRQYFRRILDKYKRYFDPSELEGEFTVNIDNSITNAIGCAFALERQNTVVSLPTHALWKNEIISGEYTFINDNEELTIDRCSVNNLHTNVSIDDVIKSYRKEMYEGISSGQDLWEKRLRLYPNLIFCDDVKDNLYEDSEKYHIMNVMTKLNRLQEYFSTYDGKYDPKKLGMNARTESDSVKNDPTLKNLRLFRKPDGSEDYFYDHIGFSGKYSGGRIHFLPDNDNRKCYIGYIGRHLETKKY